MPEHYHYDDDAFVNPETQHEKSDVSVRALMLFIVLFIVFGFVTHMTLWLLFKGLVRVERRRQVGPVTEMQRPADMAVPKNQPLLQPFEHNAQDGRSVPPYLSTPVVDLATMRDAEQRALTTYGWVDQQKGVVHIPIGEAMKLTVERGLPLQTSLSGAPAPSPAIAAAGVGAPPRGAQ